MNCPTCDLPMAWSETHERMWCSVYGDHPEQRTNEPRKGFPIKFTKQQRGDV